MPTPGPDPLRPQRSRWVGSLEHPQGSHWTCSLVTYRSGARRWRGYLSFRETNSETAPEGDLREIRTTELFVEASEGEIDRRARALGRPMISALLDSALEVEARRKASQRPSKRWVQAMLEAAASEDRGPSEGQPVDEIALRSRYASYRNEQVGHLVSLLSLDDFDHVVETLLEGQKVQFGGRDRLQFALSVVARLESLLPLPPFEAWKEDFLAHRQEYERYSQAVHAGGEIS